MVDFLCSEWDEEAERFFRACPFTSPNPRTSLLDSDPAAVRANAYDMVINGVEVGGGSIRIHDSELQEKDVQRARIYRGKKHRVFGFLMNALGMVRLLMAGLLTAFDRWVSLFAGLSSIRDTIAFPRITLGVM